MSHHDRETRGERSLRLVPSVDRVLEIPAVRRLIGETSRRVVVRAVRDTLAAMRAELRGDLRVGTGGPPAAPPSDDAIASDVARRAGDFIAPRVRRVINATGIILHTGLGRAVLAQAARDAIVREAMGPALVEIDAESGERSVRTRAVEDILCELTGAQAATVVNNNAAATMLLLDTVASGREVIVSRGQLVEIGGSFRMPDVMRKSGAILVEVGTTNRTHLRDYESAITERTGALFRAHTSNFKVVGFTTAVPIEALARLGAARGVPVIDDVGSGALVDLSRFGFHDEPVVARSIAAGADLVCFSGDKLTGGPQAGFIAGKADWIRRIEANPLARAMRVDKITLAGIEATLRLFLDEERLFAEHPTLRMLSLPEDELRRRAQHLMRLIGETGADAHVAIRADASQIGSGSLPNENLPTHVVAIRSGRVPCHELARRLRRQRPAVFARVRSDELLVDPRTLDDGEDRLVAEAVARAIATGS